ncbi:MAG: hypothetical protein KIT79_05475 [Deltaproteobacteria bacterium]|nr:hypothetical protein [Deltaproteobacteria bacterium]
MTVKKKPAATTTAATTDAGNPSRAPSQWIELGRVVKPHALKGALKVMIWSGSGDNLRPEIPLRLEHSESGTMDVSIVRAAPAGNCFHLVLKEISSPEAAEKWRGAAILAARKDLSEGLYLEDLKGAQVRVAGAVQPAGLIRDFYVNPAGQSYGVLGDGQYVALFLPEVKFADGVLHVPAHAVISADSDE